MQKQRKGFCIRIISLLSGLFLAFIQFAAPVSAESPYDLPPDTTISAGAALLVSLGATPDEDTVLYELKADSKRSPAALVRLMVGITAINIIREKGIDIEKVTGKYTPTAYKEIAGFGLGTVMSYDEEWTVKDLLSISSIQTAADACVTLAITLSGSHAGFVSEMNALTKEIGCENTSFINVSGADSPSQYTTARDLYKIIRYAMDYPEFEPLFSASQYTVKPVSGGKERSYANTNDMLRPTTPYYYSPMAFGKTGYTPSAGRCLASVAKDSGYDYLCIVMGVPNTDADGNTGVYFRDTRTLYKWAFNNFTYKTLLDKNWPITQIPVRLSWDKDRVTLYPEKTCTAIVINALDLKTIDRKITTLADSVDAPIKKGQVLGKVELYIKTDQKIGEVNLVAGESIEKSQLLAVWAQVQSFLKSPWFYAALGLIAVLLVGYIILNIVHNYKLRRNRMKRFNRFR
ncbi:MAG: D-alanyl-D-alanine carboxypeptidase [Clostridiales bacterium]|jgi:D-alanyl-D-alanine carboxypeptidase (penicillin-binding protein 5/6)|nr:D-alanyl-D-alanine carboxypeptidase [Clostridiales bacterium]